MKRIGVLTAGGDTPALNATMHGAVVRANHCKVEVFGFIKGFSSLFNPRVPHVHLNPLFSTIPELDPSLGGPIIGASRDYVDPNDKPTLAAVVDRLQRLQVQVHRTRADRATAGQGNTRRSRASDQRAKR